MGLSAPSLASRLSKLRAMSIGEVGFRIAYKATVAWERRRHAQGSLVGFDNLRRSLARPLQAADWRDRLLAVRRTSRFFPATRQPGPMRLLFETRYRAELAECARYAEATRRQRFDFFGADFEYPDEIDWQRDPVTGRQWPPVFHADVPVHGGDVGFGDVKHVWELSRQQYLIDLAKAHFLRDDAESLGALRRLVRSWVRGNPYATGVNWACALEPAFRSWSWLWAYHLTAGHLDDEFHLEWLNAFQLHGRFLERHLELYSSPFNHLIGEASALYALGLCFPEFADADRWTQRAHRVLEARLSGQFYPDGGSVEQSTFYHHATLGFYLLAALLGKENGRPFSAGVWQAIERGLDFSLQMTLPDGRTPEIGGADDGKPIRLERLPLWDFRPYLAIGAVVFGRQDFKAVAGRFYEDALWLTGPDGLTRFDAMASQPPKERMAVLVSSGYTLARSDWSDRADYLCFDCGEQAAGMRTDGVPNSMHGHADCLSVVLTLDGQRVLADSGLFAYNCGGAWEAHFRETAAHSTARIDGRDQARHIGKMAWSHSYRATLERAEEAAHGQWAIASHDGYARGPAGVVHRRAVWLRRDHYLLIWDEFVGAGEHLLEVNYQFAPGSLTAAGPDRMCFSGVVDVVWAGANAWMHDVRTGGEGPDEGWICPSLGVRMAAPRLRLTTRVSGGRTILATVLAARSDGTPRVSSVADQTPAGVPLLRVSCGEDVDWLSLDGGSPIRSSTYPALCRVSSTGRIVNSTTIDGSPADVDAGAIAALEHARSSKPFDK